MKLMPSEIGSIRIVADKLSAYWQGLTQRERILVTGLALIASALAPLSSWGLVERLHEKVEQSRLELTELAIRQRSISQDQWREVQNTTARIEGWAWTAKSVSVGQVLVEQQLNALAMAAGMTSIDISSNKDLTRVGNLSFVRLQVNADFNWTSFTRFMKALEKTNKAVIVRSVSVTGEVPSKVQLVLDLALNLDRSM